MANTVTVDPMGGLLNCIVQEKLRIRYSEMVWLGTVCVCA